MFGKHNCSKNCTVLSSDWKKGKAIACMEYFDEDKDKVSLLKKAKHINEAIQILFTNKKYDDLYHLLKGQESFERGAEMAQKLNNNQVHCEFLLLLVKNKLCTAKYNETKDKIKDAEMLEKANDNLCDSNVTLRLQVKLMHRILKEDPLGCFNVCKKFISINHFGAIEALNAAFNFRSPKLLDLDRVVIIVDCLQCAYDIVDDIEKTGKLSLKQLQLQFRNFYQMEQSEGKFFFPPNQFYWMPKLDKICMAEKDSDGMVQCDELKVYKQLKAHFKSISHKWLLLDLEKILFNIMISENYFSLNSVLDKNLDIREFPTRSYNISDYLTCCMKIIQIACFHDVKNIKRCDIEDKSNKVKLTKWGKLEDYALIRLYNIFSPQWIYYFMFSDTDIRLIKKSKLVYKLLFTMLHSDKKIKNNINKFLENWRILKLADCDASTLEECLKKEENKFKNKQEEKVKDKQSIASNDKQNSTAKQTDQTPLDEMYFTSSDSNCSHVFFVWLQSCKCLENADFMGFAKGITERFILMVSRKSFKPNITVINITYMLEIICIGLFGSLQAADAHINKRNTSVCLLFPKFYEHLVTSFDPINFTPHAFLDLIITSVASSKNPKQIKSSCLHLLQLIFHLLLGKIEPSFNVLRYASSVSVYNNGFERCLVLCLSVLGNLWPLLHGTRCLSNMFAVLKTTVLHCNSKIKENLPKLFTSLQQMHEIKNSKGIFNILLAIQGLSHSYMVSLQYQYNTNVEQRFTFNRIEQEQFPTFPLKTMASFPRSTRQRQQNVQLQHHERSNELTAAHVTSTVKKATKKHTTTLQQSQPNKNYTYSQICEPSDVSVTSETSSTDQDATRVGDHLHAHVDNCNVDEEQTESTSIFLQNQAFQLLISEPSDTSVSPTLSKASLQTCSGENRSTDIAQADQTPIQTIPMLSEKSETSEKLAADSIVNSSNQEIPKKSLVDTEQKCEGDIDVVSSQLQQHNTKSSLFGPSYPSYSSAGSTDIKLLAEHVHSQQSSVTIKLQPAPVSAPASVGLPESYDVGEVEEIIPFTLTKDNQSQHITSSSEDIQSDVAFQSELSPDSVPFESRLETNDEVDYFAPNFPSGDSEQIQDHNYYIHGAYHQTSYQTPSDPNLQAYYSDAAPNPMLFPLIVTYHPVTGQLVYMPTIPTMYWPNPPMINQPTFHTYGYDTSARSPQLHEDFKNPLPIDDTSIDNRTYCDLCGVPIDEQSKENHYTSAQHKCNIKDHSAYQEVKNKYKKVFEDAKSVIDSARRGVHVGIQTQIEKLKEYMGRFDRERKRQIEDKFAWSSGQVLIQYYAEQVDILLKEYHELLQLIKDARTIM